MRVSTPALAAGASVWQKTAYASTGSTGSPQTGSGTAVAPRPPTQQPPSVPLPVRAINKSPQQRTDTTTVRADNNPPQPDTSIQQSKNRVDSLVSQGRYLEAMRATEVIEDKTDVEWVKNRRQNIGNRYCEDRRSLAVNSFVAARKAKRDSLHDQYLRQSLADLDSCLFEFPDAPVSEKVRRNRALVEKELHR